MKNITNIAIMLVAVLVAASSCVKLQLHNTPHPDMGAVVLTTEWPRPESATIPVEHTLRISSTAGVQNPMQLSERTNVLPLFNPATYNLLVYNLPESATVVESLLRIDKLPDGTLATMPGWFYNGNGDVTPIADDTVHVTVGLKQYMYEIYIELTITEGEPERIASQTAMISGLAWQMEMLPEAAIIGTSAEIRPVLTRKGDKLTGMFRTLGFTGSSQSITINLVFVDGQSRTIDAEIPGLISAISERDPSVNPKFTMKANINTPVTASVAGTITNWDIVTESIHVN